MNFLTFIFSLLLILSFGTYAAIEKQAGDRRLRATYLGHLKANRKVLSKCEMEAYSSYRSVLKPPSDKEKEIGAPHIVKAPEVPRINPECARINLWPLIKEGPEEHPFLYETAAKLFKTFYSSLFENRPRAEYSFLDHFLKIAKKEDLPIALEKLSVGEAWQHIYYKMLKGTKEWSLKDGIGYPSLLDSISIEEAPSRICLFHAHPDQLAVLFGPKAALKLFAEMHQKNPPPISKDLIERVCSESHLMVPDPALYGLIEIGRSRHRKKAKTTFIEEDPETHISLRKNVYLPSS